MTRSHDDSSAPLAPRKTALARSLALLSLAAGITLAAAGPAQAATIGFTGGVYNYVWQCGPYLPGPFWQDEIVENCGDPAPLPPVGQAANCICTQTIQNFPSPDPYDVVAGQVIAGVSGSSPGTVDVIIDDVGAIQCDAAAQNAPPAQNKSGICGAPFDVWRADPSTVDPAIVKEVASTFPGVEQETGVQVTHVSYKTTTPPKAPVIVPGCSIGALPASSSSEWAALLGAAVCGLAVARRRRRSI